VISDYFPVLHLPSDDSNGTLCVVFEVSVGLFYLYLNIFILLFSETLSSRSATLETGFSSQVRVKFVVDSVALGQVFFQYVCFPLSVSSHQRSILIYIFILLPSEEETDKTGICTKSNALS
jgi:hypothetical protein